MNYAAKGCFLFSVFLSLTWGLRFETLEVAKDSDGQTDIYAPHTVVESRLVGDELYAFFMNSVVQVQTPEFILARNVCAPYVVLRLGGNPAVISSPCDGELHPKLVTASGTTVFPSFRFLSKLATTSSTGHYTLSQTRQLPSTTLSTAGTTWKR